MGYLQSLTQKISGLYSSAISSAGDAVISAGQAEDNAIASTQAEASSVYQSTVGAVSSAAGTASDYLKILTIVVVLGVVAYLLAQINLLRGK